MRLYASAPFTRPAPFARSTTSAPPAAGAGTFARDLASASRIARIVFFRPVYDGVAGVATTLSQARSRYSDPYCLDRPSTLRHGTNACSTIGRLASTRRIAHTNNGGWEMSGMRKWLSSNFIAMLPDNLVSGIVEVRKSTNNVGYVTDSNDTSVVSKTEDKIWLLSMSEVYGRITGSVYCSIYGAEGTQYQLYADQGVSTTLYDFCKKSGASSWWWLRSPYADGSSRFLNVGSDGDWGYWVYARIANGVSPGFCF